VARQSSERMGDVRATHAVVAARSRRGLVDTLQVGGALPMAALANALRDCRHRGMQFHGFILASNAPQSSLKSCPMTQALTPTRDPAGMLERTLVEWGGHDDLWIFGYASLIWRPEFDYAERRAAKVH